MTSRIGYLPPGFTVEWCRCGKHPRFLFVPSILVAWHQRRKRR